MTQQELLDELRYSVARLTEIKLVPFGMSSTWLISSSARSYKIRLSGIHYCGTRNSLLNAPSIPKDADFRIDHLGIEKESVFLSNYLNGQLGHSGEIILYDTGGRSSDDGEFVRPVHVSLYMPAGYIDVLCEIVQIERMEE